MVRVRGRWLALTFATVVAVGAGAVPVAASTTLGAVTSATGTVIVDPGGGGLGIGAFGVLSAGSTYIQAVDDPGQPSYAAPTVGVITGWRAELGAMVTSTFKLKVVRPGAGGQFTVVGESAGTQAGVLSSINDVSFASRVPVLAGDRIGLMLPPGSVAGQYQAVLTGSVSSVAGDPQGTVTPGATSAGQRLQLQATLEPDGDGDGYGDETQDACPTDPVRQSPPCAASAAPVTPPFVAPPLVIVAPKSISASRAFLLPSAKACISRRAFTIRIRKLPGVTFISAVVKVNGKRVKTVPRSRITAPVNLKSLPPGKVKVSITATATDGRSSTGTRTYRTCARKRRSQGPKL